MDRSIVGVVPAERRVTPRKKSKELAWLSAARLRPGRDVVLIDVSTGGALIEANARLLPGARAVLQLFGQSGSLLACGSVLRCHVSAITPQAGVTYRGALVFDHAMDFSKEPLAVSRSIGLSRGNELDGHELPSDDLITRSAVISPQ